MLDEAGLVERSRIIMEKPFGVDLESARSPQRRAPRGLRRAADLPDRPLPRQGGGPEHPGLPLRQRAVRADLAPQPHRPHPDRRARVARPRAARRLLRGDRRLPRHGGHAPVPGARLHRDGAADRPGAVRDQRGEEQGLPLDAADRAARRRPRAVRRLPRHRGRRPGVRDRDVHRPQVLRRQLALGRRAVLPAHRQADGRGGPDHLDRVPGAAAVDVPARLGVGDHGPDHLTFDLADQAKMSLSFYGKRPGPGMQLRQALDAVRDARDRLGRRRAGGLRAADLRRRPR